MKLKITFIATLAILGTFIKSQAQTIPNAGFETWINYGSYSDPAGWASFNSYSAGSGIFTTEQGTPGATGTSYLKLTVKNIPLFGGASQGVAISTPTLGAGSPVGFPISSRPANLTGQWQYLSTANDTLLVQAVFTKWNTATLTSDFIGMAQIFLTGNSVTSWTNFSLPINYFSGATPDSTIIYLVAGIGSSSDLVVGDYLYIDDLAFTGTVAGIEELQNQLSMTIAPNPFASQTTVTFNEEQKNATITLMNVVGKTVKTFQFSGSQLTIDRDDLPSGVYFLQMNDGKNSLTKKIIMQ